MLVAIDTDCIDNSKSNYHMITTTTPPIRIVGSSVYIQFNMYLTFVIRHRRGCRGRLSVNLDQGEVYNIM